jgi:hypothetical protein
VGTITEAHDVLRLLYTHLGEVSCPHGHGPARTFTPEQAAADLEAGAAGGRFTLLARVARPEGRADRAAAALGELIRQGFSRRLDEATGEVVRMEPGARWPKALDPLPLVLGRFRAGPDTTARVTATVEEAYRLGRGRAEALGEPAAAGDAPAVRYYARELGCPVCGETLRRPSPALFSFNSPLGACDTCQGFGRLIGIDRERVVPDPGKSLAERPIAPWNTPAYEELYDDLLTAARRRRLPLDRPWRELSDEERQWVWSGEGDFVNLDDFFAWLEQRTYKVHVRVLLARYRAYEPCPDCGGTRLKPEARAVRVEGRTLPELTAMSIEALRAWLGARRWTARQRATAGHLLEELGERVEVLHRVGLDYLTLDRQARTLSGGETQRIHLAAALGSGLTSTLYVLDEPTIGLHPQDSDRLLDLLRDLAARGNTVLVVEHDRTLIRGGRARPHPDPRRRPRHRPRAGGRRARRPGDGGGDDRGRAGVGGVADRALPARAAGHPGAAPRRPLPPRAGARAAGRRARGAAAGGDPRRPRAQPARPRRRLPARRDGGGDRGLRIGQVDADRKRPPRHIPALPGGGRRRPRRGRRALRARRAGRRHPGRPAAAGPLQPLQPGDLRQGLRRHPPLLRRHRRGAPRRVHLGALLVERRQGAVAGG